MFIELLFTFFIVFASLFLLRKVARRVGLANKPSGRKLHIGNVPLVGGVTICITIVKYIYPFSAQKKIAFLTRKFRYTMSKGVFDEKVKIQ